MDPYGGNQQNQRRHRSKNHGNPQLFEDTSTQPPPFNPGPMQPQDPNAQYGYSQPYSGFSQGAQFSSPPPGQSSQAYPPNQAAFQGFPTQQFLQDPMANMAMQYGQNIADQGKDYVHKNIEKYVSTSKLKYYFAVDTSYVGKKIGLILFPFVHKDWSIQYNQDEPVAPRYEVNAPDLYIPVMAFVTYILLAGLLLGTQDRFTPEQLGMTCSTALVWMVIEILVLLIAMYILNVTTDLKYLDITAYCGYKYVAMITCLVAGLVGYSTGYYVSLIWTSISLSFFLVRSLKFAIIPHAESDGYSSRGNKRQLYMLLVIALSQPVFMWWLTSHLISV